MDALDTMRYDGEYDVVVGDEYGVPAKDEFGVVVHGRFLYRKMIAQTESLGDVAHIDKQVECVITEYAKSYNMTPDQFQSLTEYGDVAVLKRAE